jgi:hypothetical protein
MLNETQTYYDIEITIEAIEEKLNNIYNEEITITPWKALF